MRRRRARALPLFLLIGGAFAAGIIVGAAHAPPYRRTIAAGFVRAWGKGDYVNMYADIDPRSRGSITPSSFATLYRVAAKTATATAMRAAGKPRRGAHGAIVVPVEVRTRLFGTLRRSFTFRFSGTGRHTRISWTPSLQFPGLHVGQRLTRRMRMPQRAALLTRSGSVLASGPGTSAGERASPLGPAASAVVGSIGPIPSGRRAQLESEGLPAHAIVGVSGLELIFDSQLRGRPGGVLLAGGHVIARAQPKQGSPVHTTISAHLQEATVRALGGQYGGIAVLQPSTGQVLAVAGIGIDALQPPGSTFKMVTVTGILKSGIATPKTTFPDKTYALLEGVKLHNAESESCGGTLELSFAVSCNSVFSPLGVQLGAARLVATAESYGFNHPAGIPGAAESTIPPASGIKGALALGSSAIGQGEVLASPLEMAVIAATIADGGVRHQPTFALDSRPRSTRVSSPKIAAEIRNMMVAVVREGTGPNAAVPGVLVAGKTGTAELGAPPGCTPGEGAPSQHEPHSTEGEQASGQSSCPSSKASTDAWFAAFAPAQRPTIALAVLMVRDGYGAESAAPAAKQILEADLRG